MQFDQVVSFFKKAKKSQAVGLLFDDCGCGDNACAYILFVNRITDNGDGERALICENSDGRTKILDESDFDSIVKTFYVRKRLKKKFHEVREDKRPKTRSKHVGIEIEFMSQLSSVELETALAEAGLENYVTAKDDGSIECEDDYPYSHEVCILAPEKSVPKVVSKFCAIINGNSTVNSSCGLHVHLDMRNRDKEKAYANLWAAQPLLYSMCPKSRRTGTYSRPVMTYHSLAEDPHGDERYVGVNKESLSKHNTLEVRLHSGTINAAKIINWVKLLSKIVDAPKVDGEVTVNLWKSIREAKRKIKLTGKLSKYVDERIKKFEKQHEGHALSLSA